MASNCTADDGFGPFVSQDCRGGFDFTLLFEQSVTALLPANIFILAGSARAAYLVGRQTCTPKNPIRIAKFVSSNIPL